MGNLTPEQFREQHIGMSDIYIFECPGLGEVHVLQGKLLTICSRTISLRPTPGSAGHYAERSWRRVLCGAVGLIVLQLRKEKPNETTRSLLRRDLEQT